MASEMCFTYMYQEFSHYLYLAFDFLRTVTSAETHKNSFGVFEQTLYKSADRMRLSILD